MRFLRGALYWVGVYVFYNVAYVAVWAFWLVVVGLPLWLLLHISSR